MVCVNLLRQNKLSVLGVVHWQSQYVNVYKKSTELETNHSIRRNWRDSLKAKEVSLWIYHYRIWDVVIDWAKWIYGRLTEHTFKVIR